MDFLSAADFIGPYGHRYGSPSECVEWALKLSRKPRLTPDERDFAVKWLNQGLQGIAGLELKATERELSDAIVATQAAHVGPETGSALGRALNDRVLVPSMMAWAWVCATAGRRRGDLPERRRILVAIQKARQSTLTAERLSAVRHLLELGIADIAGYRLEAHEDELVVALYGLPAVA